MTLIYTIARRKKRLAEKRPDYWKGLSMTLLKWNMDVKAES